MCKTLCGARNERAGESITQHHSAPPDATAAITLCAHAVLCAMNVHRPPVSSGTAAPTTENLPCNANMRRPPRVQGTNARPVCPSHVPHRRGHDLPGLTYPGPAPHSFAPAPSAPAPPPSARHPTRPPSPTAAPQPACNHFRSTTCTTRGAQLCSWVKPRCTAVQLTQLLAGHVAPHAVCWSRAFRAISGLVPYRY